MPSRAPCADGPDPRPAPHGAPPGGPPIAGPGSGSANPRECPRVAAGPLRVPGPPAGPKCSPREQHLAFPEPPDRGIEERPGAVSRDPGAVVNPTGQFLFDLGEVPPPVLSGDLPLVLEAGL